jgi:RNA polymerase sigma-70 factor (ECF subfamily)
MAKTLSQPTNRSTPSGQVEAVYREHFAHLWRALLAYSGDPDIASDAASEAFAQALRRDGDLRVPERWVWRAAFRIAAGLLKERSRFVPLGFEPAESEPAPFELHDALMEVSPRQRAALFLHYYGGYPPREIARMIGSTQSAVRVHLFRGRKRLHQSLREVGHD